MLATWQATFLSFCEYIWHMGEKEEKRGRDRKREPKD